MSLNEAVLVKISRIAFNSHLQINTGSKRLQNWWLTTLEVIQKLYLSAEGQFSAHQHTPFLSCAQSATHVAPSSACSWLSAASEVILKLPTTTLMLFCAPVVAILRLYMAILRRLTASTSILEQAAAILKLSQTRDSLDPDL